MPPRGPRIALRLLVVALAAGAAHAAATTPAVVVLAASGPVLLWTAALLVAARRARPPWDVAVASLLGGAVLAAPAAALVNELALAGAASAAGGRVPVLVAPLVEETAKGLALGLVVALRRDAFAGARAGLVWAALVALGFTWQENLQYLALAAVQGGWPGLEQGIVVRGLVGGPVHAVFTAAIGVGLGRAVAVAGGRREAAWVLGGLAVAVGQHVAWNGVGAVLVMQALCGPDFAAIGCARAPRRVPPAAVLVVTLAFTAPGALFALVAARRDRGGS